MSDSAPSASFSLKRLLPLLVLAAGLVAFFVFDLGRFLSFSALSEHRHELLNWVAANAWLAPLIYALVYIVVVAFSLPAGSAITISGGFLFGAVFGALYTVIGATIGATILFLIARTSLGEPLRQRAGPWLARMQAGFAENAMNYLLVLRLIPLFPFWLVNLAPAFLGVRLRTYFIATFAGIIPGTFVYSLIGAGLGSVFESGEAFAIGNVMTPEILGALIGLGLLALLPVVYKKIKAKRVNNIEPHAGGTS